MTFFVVIENEEIESASHFLCHCNPFIIISRKAIKRKLRNTNLHLKRYRFRITYNLRERLKTELTVGVSE